jgi:penicillin-binding protein 2
VSRAYPSSPAASRHPARWPWLLGVLIVAALVTAGSVVGGGPLQVGGLRVDGRSGQDATEVSGGDAAALPQSPEQTTDGTGIRAGPTPAPTAAAPTETLIPAPTAAPAPRSEPAGVGGGTPGDLPVVVAEASGDFVPAPMIQRSAGAQNAIEVAAAAGETVDTGSEPSAAAKQATEGTPSADASAQAGTPSPADSPIPAIEEFARRWSAGDYDGLYDLISSDAQESIERQAFIDRYVGIAERAGLTEVHLEVSGEPNLRTEVPITVTFQSSRVGEIVEENTIGLVKEDGEWRVRWTPSLIFKDLGTDGCVELTFTDTERGTIYDRNGKALAIDGTIGVIGIVPGELGNASEEATTVQALSELIDMPVEDITAAYADAPDPTWFFKVKEVSEERAESLLVEISELPGVRVQYTAGRVYPYGALAAHITGYLSPITADDIAADPELEGQEWVARAGIEAGADEILSSTPGARLAVVDCESRSERSLIGERAGEPAQDIVLTIDIDFQKSVDEALTAVEGSERGSAVVIDPRTGAVMAMVSHPSFDPNIFILGMTDEEVAYLNDEAQKPLLNRAAQAAYPTGSIFKAITMAAGMAHLGYTGDTQIECPATYVIPGTDVVVNDWVVEEGAAEQGTLTLHNALVQSCNTVFYQIGYDLDRMDENLLPDMAKAFGLGAPTGIPYLPESNGTVPDPQWKQDTIGDFWARGDAINLSIGQGFLLATPLQMANAYAAIANNGSLLQPFLVEFAQDPQTGEQERIGERDGIRRLPIEREQLQEIQSALRDQTSNAAGVGSARVFGDFQWPIAGKTGTAQTQRGRQDRDSPHSWFAAFGPYGDRATIASVVMVESKGEGVAFAAPATRAIYEAYIKSDLAQAMSTE